MKKVLFIMAFALSLTQIFAQTASKSSKSDAKEDRNFRVPLIGETAPSFTAETTNGTLNFPSDFGRKWKILFSHPQDFTPVCSTEIIELARLQGELDKLGVKIAILSTDPVETHLQWKKSMESLDLNSQGAVKIKFPLIGDDDLKVAKLYGMIHPESNTTKSVRGVFIIDPNNIIQVIYFYPANVGRNTDEILRTVAALETSAEQSTATSHVFAPVNWNPGKDLLVSIPPKAQASKSSNDVPEGYYSPVWYMWFKKSSQ
ncbi:MAG: redoxin domain-containing protein [Bacteroidales bacterium]|nr:redoxin domain-containing protein [Bacteroidales bacterium]MBK8882785.1 redoxin domain-containing protein [Bacteroidales bacterium]